MRRWVLFLCSILMGIAVGYLYGRNIHPIQYVDTSLGTLRTDYKTDYVLMVAETYSLLGDAAAAAHSLANLDALPPLEIIHQAILYAEQAGYNYVDLSRMRSLQSALENLSTLSPSPP